MNEEATEARFPHLGPFYGDHLTPEAMDAFIARFVKPEDWSIISDLYERKWYGYRFLSPGACFFLFADRYRKAYRAISARLLARRRTPRFTQEDALSPNSRNPMAPGDLTGLWNAMCIADELGIPYDVYCTEALEYGHRCGWKFLPRPTQLYSDKIVVAVTDAWRARSAERVYRTTDAHYSLKNNVNHPWQRGYMDFLIASAMKRENPKFALASVMFKDPQVRPSYAAAKVGVALVKEASAYAGKL